MAAFLDFLGGLLILILFGVFSIAFKFLVYCILRWLFYWLASVMYVLLKGLKLIDE